MGIELSPRIIDHGFRKKRESSCLAFLDVGILFGCILSSVPPLYLPTNQPLAYRANRPRQYSNGQSSPANAKRNTTRVRKRPMCCVFVCCCCCCCRSCTRGFVVWLQVVWMCKVWFSSCSDSESVSTASVTAAGIPRWPEPTSPFSHFPPAPTSSGRGISCTRLVKSIRLVKSNKMQQNVAKTG